MSGREIIPFSRSGSKGLVKAAQKIVHSYVTGGMKTGLLSAGKQGVKAAVAAQMVKEAYNHLPTLTKKQRALRGGRIEQVINAPVSQGHKLTTGVPMVSRNASGVRVQNRELLEGTLTGTTSFGLIKSYFVNPGLAATFPWLSVQANQYEQYRFRSLKFIYVPSVSTASAGDLMMMFDYNVQDPVPTTETQFLDHPGSKIAAVWESNVIAGDTRQMHALGPRKFIRSVAVAGDPKTYDVAKFNVGTNNTAGAAVGKLFVEYDVELYVPQLVPSAALTPSLTSETWMVSAQAFTTNVDTTILWTGVGYDPLNFLVTNSSGVFTPPAGMYDINVICTTNDGTNETFQSYLTLFKGSTQYNSASSLFTSSQIVAGSALGEICNLNIRELIPFNGSETFKVNLKLIGAAGSLTLLSARLIIKLA